MRTAALHLIGITGLIVFVFAVLAAVAQPVAAADGWGGCVDSGSGFFNDCAELDTSRIVDMR